MKQTLFTTIRRTALLCLLLIVSGSWATVLAQVSIAAHNTDVTTNFNSWNGTMPTGWARFANNNYIGTSASTTGGVYAIPNAGFDYRPSSNATATACWVEGTYQNNTGSAITSLQISYQAFQVVAEARMPNWTATSSLGSVSALNWTFNSGTSPASPSNLTTTLTVNIAPGSTFTIRFSSDRGSGSGSSPIIGLNNVKMRSITAACAAPTGLAAANITDVSADLSWNTVSGAAGYQYVVDQTSGNPAGAGTATTGTSFNQTGLTASTTNYLHVRTDCGGSFSAWTTIPFTTIAAPCIAPTGLTAANLTATSADLSWNTQAGVSGYQYVVDQNAADPATAGTATTGTSFNATGLTSSTTYYLHVHTDCGGGNLSPWTTISFLTQCAAPTGLIATTITDVAADLSWNTQTGVAGYEYVVDENIADPATAGTTTVDTFYNATGLTQSTTYYLHVHTDCGSGNLSEWTTIPFTTLCPAPAGLTSANITDVAADLSWNTQTGVAGYEYVVDENVADPTNGTATVDTFYNATGLTQSTTYYLHVRTDCGSGLSAWTTISFTTTCPAPAGLTSTNITDVAADLSWDTQAGVAGYEYVVDENAADPATAGTATVDTFYNATGLTQSTTYYLHVRTDCGGGLSDWTTIPFTTLCPAPTGLTAANVSDVTADLSWNTQTGVAGYEYVVDENAADPATAGTSVVDTFYNATGLTQSTTYYLHVRTDCGGGLSDWTTIPFTTGCPAPTGLTSTNITDVTADLSWNTQTGVAGYEYVIDENAADPATAGTSVVDTFYNATGLTQSTMYYLHVRTDCGGGLSDWTTISFTTFCPVPTGAAASNVTHESADLSWDAPGSFEYVFDQNAADPATAGTATTVTTLSEDGLTELTTYYLHVRTDCGSGSFSDWTTISFTTVVTPCAAPTGLSVTNITATSATLSWDSQAGVTGYQYTVNTAATDPATAGTATTATIANATGLAPSTGYYLHVRTDCGNGNFSPWVTIPFATVAPCPAPTGLSASNITGTTATVNWTSQAGVTGYEYVVNQISSDPAGAGTVTTNNNVGLTALSTTTGYYVHVRTNCGNGNFSDWSVLFFSTLSNVGLDEAQELVFSAYPNPAQQQVTIQAPVQEGTITLINVHGQQLRTIDLQLTTEMELSGIESGMYILLYELNGVSSTARLVVQH